MPLGVDECGKFASDYGVMSHLACAAQGTSGLPVGLHLTIATLVLAVIFLLKGAFLLWGSEASHKRAMALLYNRGASITLWAVAVAWVLWETLKLGPADFGDLKWPLFTLFAALGISSIWMLKDYLIVRAGCVLWLLLAWRFLKAAFLRPEGSRLLMVGVVYLLIVAALYLAVAPWRARDILEALAPGKKLRGVVGKIVFGVGALLMLAAATYRWA